MNQLVKQMMTRSVLVLTFLALGTCAHSYALTAGSGFGGCVSGSGGPCAAPSSVPEIDPSMAGTGIVLLGGTVLLVRARRRQ